MHYDIIIINQGEDFLLPKFYDPVAFLELATYVTRNSVNSLHLEMNQYAVLTG